jgi:outer membrane lipoprotein-sorting protein
VRRARAVVFAAAVCGWLAVAGGGVERVSAAAGQAAAGQAAAGRLETVLREMDAASAKFQSAQADLRQELYTKVVDDNEEQKGMVYFLRKGGATQMGIKMLEPAQIVEFKDGLLRLFNPGTNHVDEFSASGKNQSLAETLMTLGFGGSGAELKRAWTIDDEGAEQMSDGSRTVAVERLDLVSKDETIKKNYSHVTIWIDAARGVTLKQEFFAANGDTRTAFYTNIRMNQTVDVGPFAIKCKGKCG